MKMKREHADQSVDESYVQEILNSFSQPIANLNDFNFKCRVDINAGYSAEVAEAARRYFNKD